MRSASVAERLAPARVALRNALRHRFRTAMTLAAVTIGVAALILVGGFVRDVFVQLAEAIVHSQTGHIQIVRPEFLGAGSRSPEKQLLPDVEALRRAAGGVPGTAEVMARLRFTGLLNNGRADLPIVAEGIEPAREARLQTNVTIVRGRALRQEDTFGAFIGEGVAQALKLAPGDHVVLLANTPEGALNTVDLDVVGVFRSFSREFDARAVRLPLAAAQELLTVPGANSLVIALERTEDTAAALATLREKIGSDLAIKSWRELDDFYDKTVVLYERQFGVLELIVLLMVVLTVTNTVNMSVFERTAEYGTMRALGNTRATVFGHIMTENLVIGVAGALLGAVIGAVLAGLLSSMGIPMPPPPSSNMSYVAQIRLSALGIAQAMAVGVAASVFASVLPALRAARTPIADALRRAV